ncbi:MAG: hypothetical protein JXP73_06560 [Deltaproteobacteria bacterium]|nr:hypothetical protein [Deltaproteobacteria bacterium]
MVHGIRREQDRAHDPGWEFGEFPIPTPDSVPYGIVVGPDNNLRFAESKGNKIGRITP